MAQEQEAPEGSEDRFSSSSSVSKKIEEASSLPGGRSSAAERRVGVRPALTPAEQEALVRALESSGGRVRDFAIAYGVGVQRVRALLVECLSRRVPVAVDLQHEIEVEGLDRFGSIDGRRTSAREHGCDPGAIERGAHGEGHLAQRGIARDDHLLALPARTSATARGCRLDPVVRLGQLQEQRSQLLGREEARIELHPARASQVSAGHDALRLEPIQDVEDRGLLGERFALPSESARQRAEKPRARRRKRLGGRRSRRERSTTSASPRLDAGCDDGRLGVARSGSHPRDGHRAGRARTSGSNSRTLRESIEMLMTLTLMTLGKRRGRPALCLCLASASLLSGCGSPWKKGEPWSFALTRDILDRESSQPQHEDWEPTDPSVSGAHYRNNVSTFHGGVEELWILAIVCLPTAIDLALLPFTGVHDLCME